MAREAWIKPFEEAALAILQESVPGMALGVARGNQLCYFRGFGYRDMEKQLEISIDTVFGIASITKSISCIAIMQLQDAGKLSVHTPVIEYLPEFRVKNGSTEQITIHHLMTNSSGLPPLPVQGAALKRCLDADPDMTKERFSKEWAIDYEPLDTYVDLMDCIASLDFQLLGPPGTQFSYSNEGFSLLGAIVERVSGKTYEEYVVDSILRPAGMSHSCFLFDELNGYENITMIYDRRPKDHAIEVYPSPVWWDAPAMRPCGYVRSTVSDMLKYAEIFRTGGLVGDKRILSTESVKQMTTPYMLCELDRYYGYGLMITPDYHGTTLIEHSGSAKGVAAQMSILPEKGLTGVALANLNGSPSSSLLAKAFNAIEERSIEASHLVYRDHLVPNGRLEDYVGEFRSGEGAHLIFHVENGSLRVSQDMLTVPLRAIGEDLFLLHLGGMEYTIRFIRNHQNQVIRAAAGYRQLTKNVKNETMSIQRDMS